MITTAFLLALSPILPQDAPIRHELGIRLRAMEVAWEHHPEAEARRRALPFVDGATRGYFVRDFGGVGRRLDLARHALGHDGPVELDWFDPITVRPATKLFERGRDRLSLELGLLYEGPEVPAFELRVVVVDSTGERFSEPQRLQLERLPWTGVVFLGELPEGDHELRVEGWTEGQFRFRRSLGCSVVELLSERLDRLERSIATAEGASPLSRDSAGFQLEMLRKLAAGELLETELPSCRLLRQAEASLGDAGDRFRYGPEEPGQHWLAFRTGKMTWPARALVPSGLAPDEPVPLVLALHGMGGSENLFFEGYGNGAIVGLCEERGWLLVAPRLGLFGDAALEDLVEAIATDFPVDRERVFLVGHSMGAERGLQAAARAPECWAGLAALGGGRPVRGPGALVGLPVFIGAGEKDFALPGARGLHGSLMRAGSRWASLKVYPDTEHITVVQVALGDVFRFFDEALRARR